GAENANELLGMGTTLTLNKEGEPPKIKRGLIINWRGSEPDTAGICHWAVSLGDGNAIGANNSAGGRLNGEDVLVRFVSGGSAFGVFPIKTMCDIYRGDKTYSPSKKKTTGIVATIDPATVPNRNIGKKAK